MPDSAVRVCSGEHHPVGRKAYPSDRGARRWHRGLRRGAGLRAVRAAIQLGRTAWHCVALRLPGRGPGPGLQHRSRPLPRRTGAARCSGAFCFAGFACFAARQHREATQRFGNAFLRLGQSRLGPGQCSACGRHEGRQGSERESASETDSAGTAGTATLSPRGHPLPLSLRILAHEL